MEGAGRLLKKGRLSEGNFKLHRRSLLEEKRLFKGGCFNIRSA